jgi:hypothetical protein
VLRVDDRMLPSQKERAADATSADFATDAEAKIDYCCTDVNTDQDRIDRTQ